MKFVKDDYLKEQGEHKQKMLKALEASLGVVTLASKGSGVGRTTHYRWLQDDPEYRKKVEDIENMALDFAESKLHKQIEKNNVTAIIFYLKCRGKGRGYIERTEVNDISDKEITIKVKHE